MKYYAHVSSAGHQLVCFVCHGDEFEHHSATLLTSGIANSGFNANGQLAVCATCGYVHTFFGGNQVTFEPIDDVSG